MVLTGSLQLSHGLGFCKNQGYQKQVKRGIGRDKLHLSSTSFTSRLSLRKPDSRSISLSENVHKPLHTVSQRFHAFKCYSSVTSGQPGLETAAMLLKRPYNVLQGYPLVFKLVPSVGIIIFAIWGLAPLMRLSRNLFLHVWLSVYVTNLVYTIIGSSFLPASGLGKTCDDTNYCFRNLLQKSDNSWKKSNTHYVTNSYIQPLLLWTGAMLICRALDPVILPTEASQVVKQRLVDFVRSLSTVLSFAYCLSSVIQQAQKYFMENNESSDTRNMGLQFAGKAVYSAVWVAAVSLFMELLGFSTQKWLTAGGLGTVLLTLAGREIFTNFLSSAMIHATRPFVGNEWIQTRIEGYEVSGHVEHVGWWSPTIVRGEDREAVHIPNHKFTVNVVRNLSQKTHWRIKTHLAISHLDVHKINSIVADMRKVLSKNPHIEQQRLHRRVFLENVTPDNQALMILISCFVKTSHHEEYLCVKEAILMDLLRVVSHHQARLATPIRTVQKMYNDADSDSIPYADSMYSRGGVSPRRSLLLIEPSYKIKDPKINGEDKKRSRPVQTSGERDGKATVRSPTDSKVDAKVGATSVSDSKTSKTQTSDTKLDTKSQNLNTKEDPKASKSSTSDPKVNDKAVIKAGMISSAKTNFKDIEKSSSDFKASDISSDHSAETMSGRKQVNYASGADKTGGSMPSPVKQEGEKMTATESPTSRPALEENLVLGVALEGSKRTLPIDEGMASPSSHEDANDLSFRKGSSNTDKGRKSDQVPTRPGSACDNE